jgi:protein-S-isoprenylcysteine O-methyltransferase Ste14
MSSFWLWFAAGSVLIVWFSWRVSIRDRRYHGIARFFAFEGILTLFLLNFDFWFWDPAAPLHLLSWALLAGSAVEVAGSLSRYFKSAAPDGSFENSTRLVETGIYRFIRHPMYGSLMLLGLGIFLKRATALTSVLAAAVVLALLLTALIEEGEMRVRFGEAYAAYKKRTKRFIPFLF